MHNFVLNCIIITFDYSCQVLLLVTFIACVLKKPDLDEDDTGDDVNNILAPDEEALAKKDANITGMYIFKRRHAHKQKSTSIAYLHLRMYTTKIKMPK